MYTSADRETLLADLVAFSKKRPDVLSFILVGSGARGFTDQYSDLDVLLVAKEKEDVAAVQEACAGFLNEHYSILKQKVYHHRKDIIVSCFFLDHYLELDLGVWSMAQLRATKPDWKVFFDHEQSSQRQLEKTLAERQLPKLEQTIEQTLSFLWQFVHYATTALKRGQLLKALQDIHVIRQEMIKMICLQHGIREDFEKKIDHIETSAVQELKKSYEITLEHESISTALVELVSLYFSEAATSLGKESVETDRNMLMQYLEEQLGKEGSNGK